MYATIEADIKQGKIVPLEPEKVPASGHALVVILEAPNRKVSWKSVRRSLGWLKLRTAPNKWQRAIRKEWDGRL